MIGPDEAAAIDEAVAQTRLALAGCSSAVTGTALAQLVALWLASHVRPGDPDATWALRDALLAHHVRAVGELIGPTFRVYIAPAVARGLN